MTRPMTATAFAIERIKQLITERKLPPGARIDQAEIAAQLGVSRLPVRQALAHLAAQNFVKLRDHRSAIVTAISESDMRHLYALRWHLERWAFEQGFARFRQKHVRALEEVLNRSQESLEANDFAGFVRLNREFHFHLYEIADNPYLLGSLKNLFDLSERYHWLVLSTPEQMAASLAEHRDLVARIRDKDLEGFLAIYEHHNRKTVEYVEDTGMIETLEAPIDRPAV